MAAVSYVLGQIVQLVQIDYDKYHMSEHQISLVPYILLLERRKDPEVLTDHRARCEDSHPTAHIPLGVQSNYPR